MVRQPVPTSTPDPARFLADRCPKREEHTPMPDGYGARHEWARRKARTHRQVIHPECGLYVIWVPRQRHSA